MSLSVSYNGIIDNKFPFPFLQGFADFINADSAKKFILFKDRFGNMIPAVIWKSAFLKVLQLQFVPLDQQAKRISIQDEQLFLDELVSYISRESLCDKIVQGTNYALFKAFPKSSIVAPFGSYILNLSKNIEEIFTDLHSKNRNVIRNAQKHGVKILYGEDVIDDFYTLYKDTTRRSGLFCENIDHFKGLLHFLGNNIVCSVSYYKNEPIGGLFVLFSNYGAFYLYGASAHKPSINGAINYLQWDLIGLLKEKNVNFYDFVGARLSSVEGTRLAGIQQFKQRFGSQLEKGYLWKLEIRPIKCMIYTILLKVKLKLKRFPFPIDIIDQEREAFRQQNLTME